MKKKKLLKDNVAQVGQNFVQLFMNATFLRATLPVFKVFIYLFRG